MGNRGAFMKLKKLLSTLSVMMFTFSFSMSNSVAIHADDTNTWNFSYTGQQQTFTAPYTGTYKLEVWGAAGGTDVGGGGNSGGTGGKGGYAKGTYKLNAGQIITVYVGGQGATSATGSGGGFNGGGNAGPAYSSGGGGGASDIRVGGTALLNRIIVAGGGGGGGCNGNGGNGGGLIGDNGSNCTTNGATQASGGISYYGNGALGQGASHSYDGGGGGGGYYGGGAGGVNGNPDQGGGGGSSYIDGVSKCITTVGVNSGDGYAKITYVPTYANGIVISKRADSLEIGETDKLTALVSPDDASVKTVEWTSSDPSVVTVDDNGNITAVKAGTAVITATVQDGRNLHGQCRVEVTD